MPKNIINLRFSIRLKNIWWCNFLIKYFIQVFFIFTIEINIVYWSSINYVDNYADFKIIPESPVCSTRDKTQKINSAQKHDFLSKSGICC